LIHLPLVHGLAVGVTLLRDGRADWLYGIHPAAKPSDAGFGLGATYLAWGITVLMLYPVCRWFSNLKRRRRDAWLSYF
jgi:hypothetical protein